MKVIYIPLILFISSIVWIIFYETLGGVTPYMTFHNMLQTFLAMSFIEICILFFLFFCIVFYYFFYLSSIESVHNKQ